MKKERLIPRPTVKIALVFWAFSVHLDYCVRAFLNWCEWIFNGLNWCFFCYGWRLHGWHIGCLPSKYADGMPLRCRESLFALCSPLVGVWGAFGGLGIFL